MLDEIQFKNFKELCWQFGLVLARESGDEPYNWSSRFRMFRGVLGYRMDIFIRISSIGIIKFKRQAFSSVYNLITELY